MGRVFAPDSDFLPPKNMSLPAWQKLFGRYVNLFTYATSQLWHVSTKTNDPMTGFDAQTKRKTTMKMKTLATLIAGSFILLGCAETGEYPITGYDVGVNDQVKFMSAPSSGARY